MTNTSMLEQEINKSGYKRSYIADFLGISTYTLSMKIRNETKFKASEIEKLCKILGFEVNTRMAIFFANTVD